MTETIDVSDILPGDPHRVYQAWLDSEIHSAFTGAQASIDARVRTSCRCTPGPLANSVQTHPPRT